MREGKRKKETGLANIYTYIHYCMCILYAKIDPKGTVVRQYTCACELRLQRQSRQ